ncbi:MBL fold metallo-hydrolase [Streptomyces sp. NPDC058964]|uniref:MBL fold metallo-hydrolase n=1 Tax=Streptomyces sp. NPDC058964 TaxID=3346681 RepID=UPI0036A786C4
MSVTVNRFAAPTASVNSWLVTDDTSLIVVDVLRSSAEAAELADEVTASGKQLLAVVVTHGHPDHYIGLRTFAERFPEVPLLVASQEIADDITGFTAWMESVGWLDAEPTMKPRSTANPDGFDYGLIRVADRPELTLAGGAVVRLDTDWPAAEADHTTVVHVPDANAVLTSDLVYSGVHAWEGPQVTRDKIQSWLSALGTLQERYGTHVTVHPGHGPEGDTARYEEIRRYLDDFLAVTQTATDREEAMAEMIRRYPEHSQADFLLPLSIDFHVQA